MFRCSLVTRVPHMRGSSPCGGKGRLRFHPRPEDLGLPAPPPFTPPQVKTRIMLRIGVLYPNNLTLLFDTRYTIISFP